MGRACNQMCALSLVLVGGCEPTGIEQPVNELQVVGDEAGAKTYIAEEYGVDVENVWDCLDILESQTWRARVIARDEADSRFWVGISVDLPATSPTSAAAPAASYAVGESPASVRLRAEGQVDIYLQQGELTLNAPIEIAFPEETSDVVDLSYVSPFDADLDATFGGWAVTGTIQLDHLPRWDRNQNITCGPPQ